MEENKDQKENKIDDINSSLNAKEFRKEMMEIVFLIILAICISLLIINYIGQRTVVRGSSMEPTLHDGDQLIVYKMLYLFKDPNKGDIVVVDVPEAKRSVKSEKLYIKRVIGTEGDKVAVKDKKVFVNGIQLKESSIIKDDPNGYSYVEFPEEVVPEDSAFVLGDNRVNSRDSRELGFIPYDNIKGKAIYRIWPFDKFGKIK